MAIRSSTITDLKGAVAHLTWHDNDNGRTRKGPLFSVLPLHTDNEAKLCFAEPAIFVTGQQCYPLKNRFPDYAQIWAFFCLWVVCIKINPHNCSTSPLPPTKIWIQNGVAQYLLLKTSQIELNIGVLRLQQLCLKVRVGLTDPRATAQSSSPPDSEKQQQSSTLWTNLNLLPVYNAYFSTLHKLKLSGTTKLTK